MNKSVNGSTPQSLREAPRWWSSAVVYQIYPRSFRDANGDGIGDLQGISERLDYLAWLGVDAIWISPFYPSPMRDFGYDVSNYLGVDPVFGTLADFDAMLARAHELGMKVVIDFVPNHTSDQHPWFAESRSSRSSTKRNWYLWRDPGPGDGPPNNWKSVTGGSAWAFDEATGQYYLHSFLPFQPDLNWRNPDVEEAIFDALRFWLNRGVDGIRVDMFDFLFKDAQFRDEDDPDYTFATSKRHINQPELLDVLERYRATIDAYPDRLLIGEIFPETEIDRLRSYYGRGNRMNLPFNFKLLSTPFDAPNLRRAIETYLDGIDGAGTPNFTLGNHDTVRLASRIGPDNVNLAAMLLLTLPGAIFLYYGDELGLAQADIPPDRVQDPWEHRVPGKGRDGARTPMPWSDEAHAGFGAADEAWLPVPVEHRFSSVARMKADDVSTLSLYRNLITFRRSAPAIRLGSLAFCQAPPNVLCYKREADGQELWIVLNLSDEQVRLSEYSSEDSALVISSGDQQTRQTPECLEIGPRQGAILQSSDDCSPRRRQPEPIASINQERAP